MLVLTDIYDWNLSEAFGRILFFSKWLPTKAFCFSFHTSVMSKRHSSSATSWPRVDGVYPGLDMNDDGRG